MIPFTKMQGIGNDFIMLDGTKGQFDEFDLPALASSMCDRRFGVGGDGLIVAQIGINAPFQMRMFNPDGSESEMCGNGIRCFAKYLRELGFELNESIEVETGAGLLKCQFTDDDQVRVDMGRAKVETYPISGPLGEEGGPFWERPVQEFSATAISMGNPHIVIFQDDLQAIDLPRVGPRLEHDPLFHNRTNVHFSQVLDRTRIQMRTWERGAGVTLACGTGACAVAVAGFLTGRTNRLVTLDLPGGSLVVQYFDDQRVWMKGPAEVSFSGCYLKP